MRLVSTVTAGEIKKFKKKNPNFNSRAAAAAFPAVLPWFMSQFAAEM